MNLDQWTAVLCLGVLYLSAGPETRACDVGWVDSSGCDACYYISTDELSWDDARAACQTLDSDLTSITSTEEFTCIKDILLSHTTLKFWTGANRGSFDFTFSWSDGSPWNAAITIDIVFFKYCGLLSKEDSSDGEVVSTSCSDSNKYICKKSVSSSSVISSSRPVTSTQSLTSSELIQTSQVVIGTSLIQAVTSQTPTIVSTSSMSKSHSSAVIPLTSTIEVLTSSTYQIIHSSPTVSTTVSPSMVISSSVSTSRPVTAAQSLSESIETSQAATGTSLIQAGTSHTLTFQSTSSILKSHSSAVIHVTSTIEVGSSSTLQIINSFPTLSTTARYECSCDTLEICSQVQSAVARRQAKNLTLEEEIKELEDELTVDKKSTSKSRRKLVSADDTRPSARGIGYSGVVILGVYMVALLVADASAFRKILTMRQSMEAEMRKETAKNENVRNSAQLLEEPNAEHGRTYLSEYVKKRHVVASEQ